MLQFSKLTVAQLERAIAIKRQLEALQQQLDSLENAEGSAVVAKRGRPKRLVVDGRLEALKLAREARWARYRASKAVATAASADSVSETKPRRQKKRTISPEHKAKLAEAAKARWAKAKAAGQTTL